MKKWFNKIKLMLILSMMIGLLTGCSAGSTVETKLTINKDLSGSRVMELVINQSVYNEYFSGTIEQLNAAITESCPSQLSWGYDESTGSKVYKFTLDFSNIEDYKTKVDSIIGDESDVTINVTQADSVWASGIYVKESFTSENILAWLRTMVVEKGFVSSSNASKLFQLGGNIVSYCGEEYSANSYISIDKIEYLDIEEIVLLTDVNSYDLYDKTIILTIPENAMAKKGEEIKAWLAQRVPEGANSEWKENKPENGELISSVFTVNGKGMSGEKLEQFLRHFFDSDECVVEQKKVKDNMSPFAFSNSLVETIDFSNYVLGDRSYRTDIYYYVTGANNYKAGSSLNNLQVESDYNDNDAYPGYKWIRQRNVADNLRQYSSFSQKVYRVKDINIISTVGLFGGLSREYTFTLDAEPSDEEKEEIINNINSYGLVYAEIKKSKEEKETTSNEETNTEMTSTEESSTETEEEPKVDWDVKIEDKVKDGVYSITIKQNGDIDEIEMSSEALFGSSRNFCITKSYSFGSLSHPVAISDGYTLGHFVDYRTEEMTGTYTLNTGFGSSIEYVNVDDAVIEGAKVVITGASVANGISVIAYGSQLNMWAIFFYVFLIGGLACIVFVLKKEGIIDKLIAMIPKKEAVQQKTVEETPMFCENCGAPRDADACVCTQCGTKFEK